NIKEIVETETWLATKEWDELTADDIRHVKSLGFSDRQLKFLNHLTQTEIRDRREELGVEPVYKMVDTSAAEFAAVTPYYYSTYEDENESIAGGPDRVLILGGGPNRIGQGIEFDYCCCHASFAVRELGLQSIMMNCNPETVSTDYDTSDRLYFDPLTVEDVLSVVKNEIPLGVIIQFGGQTPLKIARKLADAGVHILGTTYQSIARAEDRDQFSELLKLLDLKQTPNDAATSLDDALSKAESIGYPILMRPSFVLGGAKMAIVSNAEMLREYWTELLDYASKTDLEITHDSPILIDKFLHHAKEIDVDALCDGEDVYVAGIMEHIEEAGIHSGDSACVLPPFSLSDEMIGNIREATRRLALELQVVGLMNVQFAVKDDELYILEVNPRASRTVPFVSKVTAIPVAKFATMLMLGKTLRQLNLVNYPEFTHYGVKGPVFPWSKFPGADIAPGPEMKSTGEVMGIDESFPIALIKSQIAAGTNFPTQGTAFVSVRDDDKPFVHELADALNRQGFHIVATRGTAEVIRQMGIPATMVNKVLEGRPHIVDDINNKKIDLVINTPSSRTPKKDEILIRTTAVKMGVPLIMSISAANIYLEAIKVWRGRPDLSVIPIQEYHSKIVMDSKIPETVA
ncbi:MAG TPA: carbamoyl-phosphate synthase large subunit, partial [bacterium]